MLVFLMESDHDLPSLEAAQCLLQYKLCHRASCSLELRNGNHRLSEVRQSITCFDAPSPPLYMPTWSGCALSWALDVCKLVHMGEHCTDKFA